MEKIYHDKFGMDCCFTETGILFSNARREVYFPYGCLDRLDFSLLGVMQAVSRAQVCCFTAGKQDRAELKALVKQAREKKKTAPAAEPVVLDLEQLQWDSSLPVDQQLRQLKDLFVSGAISKAAYDLKKKLLKA